ncbi:MAG: UvrD-helicase domain-containing protein [Deltaproteobacteria bacterium]|nr:UvrD-helicase domain-containing protein [Deltaproteobacteria bacterium]
MAEAPTIIGASAGTGKTHRLTELVWEVCGPGGEVPPDRLVAVTFTRKAAAELADRIRERLFREGGDDRLERARRLALAYLGTVHEVGLRLVSEHALDAGLPVDANVLVDDRGDAFNRVFELAIPEARAALLESLGGRLGVRWDRQRGRSDWMLDVRDIVEGARANRIAPDRLETMARRSIDGLLTFLPAPTDRDLEGELASAIATLRATSHDGKKTTTDALAAIDKGLDEVARGVWAGWLRIEGAKPTKAMTPLFEPVWQIARAHLAHPRLRDDLRTYVTEAYAAAADVMEAFADWKRGQRFVDYTDMLDLTLRVLDDPRVAEEIRSRLGLVVVDELQDSGPLQLALFARLHALVGRSYWVGDPKQCIFEWSGADPALMDALTGEARSRGAAAAPLDVNFRSRGVLVELCSELFARAFATIGLAASEVRVTASPARREDPPALAALEPLGIVVAERDEAVAETVAGVVTRMLAAPGATPVVDRASGEVRPVRPGDVAILVRTNDQAEEMTWALTRAGIATSARRAGLMATLEARLVRAGLRLLVTRGDPHAEAELEALAGWRGFGAEPEAGRRAWFEARLGWQRRAPEGAPSDMPERFTRALDRVRRELPALSVVGAVERMYEALDVPGWVEGFADPTQAVANLDALRGLARTYEDQAVQAGRGATLSGLLRAMDEAAWERGARDEQAATAADRAVQVVTYHKAKGLEWPVVILASLDSDARRTPFELWAESETQPTLADPLAGRWLRYWPWPYAAMRSGRLREEVVASATGRAVDERERRERLRLMYVGFTRARDHLVLAVKRSKTGYATGWIDEVLLDEAGTSLVALPSEQGGTATIAGRTQAVRWWSAVAEGEAEPEAPASAQRSRFVRGPGRGPRVPKWVAPSHLEVELDGADALVLGRIETLGEPLALRPRSEDDTTAAGLAMHAFLASDDPTLGEAVRLERAREWLAAHDTRAIRAADLLTAGDRLGGWCAARWAGARALRELPLRLELPGAGQVLTGTLDLLLAPSEGGLVIVDHKSARSRADHAAREHAPQLAAYRLAVARLFPESPVATWLHLPLAGVMAELVPRGAR